MPYSVCFVCTGNICRSPMAEAVFRARVEEAVFRARVEEAGLGDLVQVDSAGTDGWHEGDGADPRTVAVLQEAGYRSAHLARRFKADWFARLDLVIALDSGHLRALRRLSPTPDDADKVRLLRSYDPAADDPDVPDPYYGEFDGFEECLRMVEAASEGLLDVVREAVERRRHDGIGTDRRRIESGGRGPRAGRRRHPRGAGRSPRAGEARTDAARTGVRGPLPPAR